MELFTFLRGNIRFLSAGMILTFASCWGQTFFISIFADEIMTAYGLSAGGWGTLYGLGTLASGLTMIWAGALSDVFRTRTLALVVHLSICAFCLAMAVNSAIWLLPVIIFGLRLTGQGMGFHMAAVAMARWYVAARGKAISIAAFGFALGEAFLPLIFAALLPIINWRMLWLIPVVVMAILIPILQHLLKSERDPKSIPDTEQSLGMDNRQWTRGQAVRSAAFWLLIPVYLMPNAFGTALFFQQVHLAKVKGWAHTELVALFPIYTGVAVLSSITAGIILDRIGAVRVMRVLMIPMALSFALFSVADSIWTAALAFVIFGVTAGGSATSATALWSEIFGTRHIGAIKAAAAAVMVIASAAGPVISGVYIDRGINFDAQMMWIAGLCLIVGAVAWAASFPVLKRMPA